MPDNDKAPYCDLCGLCERLAAADDRGQLLQAVVDGAVRLLGARAALVRVLDERRGELVFGAAHGLDETSAQQARTALADNPLDRDVLAGQTVEIEKAEDDPRWREQELAEQDGLVSVYAAPLTVKDRKVGVLHVYFDSPHGFSDRERALLCTICTQAGGGLRRLRLQQQAEAVGEIASEISASLEESAVLDNITREAVDVLGFQAASIRMLDEEGTVLEEKSACGLSEAYINKGPVELDKSPLDQAVMDGRTVHLTEHEFDDNLQYPEQVRAEGIRAMLCLPLQVKGRAVGVLRVYTQAPNSLPDDDVRFLKTLASHGAVAVENARLFEHLRRDYEDLTQAVWRWYDWGERPPKM